MSYHKLLSGIFACALFIGCKQTTEHTSKELAMAEIPEPSLDEELIKPTSKEFNDYWYTGEAEISSYELKQARYGEVRDGKAVLVFVTEPFSVEQQVKSDYPNTEESLSVLKLNATKNFNTGIYPYSIMSSNFYPVSNDQHSVKVTMSMQEWCGHVYAQINNRDAFEVMSRSYFQSEGDQNFTLNKTSLENDLWQQIRIDPNSLLVGEFEMVPSLEFSRLKHIPIKAYKAQAKKADLGELTRYALVYPELKRSLQVTYRTKFPHIIESWEETYTSGFGAKAKQMTSTAKRIETIKSPYWQKNSNADLSLRQTLGLE